MERGVPGVEDACNVGLSLSIIRIYQKGVVRDISRSPATNTKRRMT
jgi:hypothetical protein